MHSTIKILGADRPTVVTSLPPLRGGDSVWLDCTLQRLRGGRQEALRLLGRFRVAASVFVASTGRQTAEIEPLGDCLRWVAVKKPRTRLGPCKVRVVVEVDS